MLHLDEGVTSCPSPTLTPSIPYFPLTFQPKWHAHVHVWVFQLVSSTFSSINLGCVGFVHIVYACLCVTLTAWRVACMLYIRPISLWGGGQETWRPCSASRGPSCVFICWANFQPRYWSPCNYTGQATGTCGMVNELQIALWTISSAGASHIYYLFLFGELFVY